MSTCYLIKNMCSQVHARQIPTTSSSSQNLCGVTASVFMASRLTRMLPAIIIVVTKRISIITESG